MKIKVAVFDWDGVLYDSFAIYTAHLNTVLQLYGKLQITPEDNRARVSGPSIMETFRRCGIIEEHDLPDAVKMFLALTQGEPQPSIFTDVHDTLRWLKERSIKTYIASAHPEEEIRRLLVAYGLEEFVAGICGNASPQWKAYFICALIVDNKIIDVAGKEFFKGILKLTAKTQERNGNVFFKSQILLNQFVARFTRRITFGPLGNFWIIFEGR